MSLNQYVTSANSQESLYITRQEVIQAFSTIVSDLSGMSTITFGVSPNPSFSTITMAPGGLISGFAPIQTSNVVFQVSSSVGFASKLVLGTVGSAAKAAITASDNNGNTAPLEASGFVAQNGSVLGSGSFLTLNATGIVANPAIGGVNLPILSWNSQIGSNLKVSLNNISTINGIVPSIPSTYAPVVQTMFGTQGGVTGKSVTSGTNIVITSTSALFACSTNKIYDVSVPISVSLTPSPGAGGTMAFGASFLGNIGSSPAWSYCVPITPGQPQTINTTLRFVTTPSVAGNQPIVVSALQQGPLFSSIVGMNIQGFNNNWCSVTNIN